MSGSSNFACTRPGEPVRLRPARSGHHRCTESSANRRCRDEHDAGQSAIAHLRPDRRILRFLGLLGKSSSSRSANRPASADLAVQQMGIRESARLSAVRPASGRPQCGGAPKQRHQRFPAVGTQNRRRSSLFHSDAPEFERAGCLNFTRAGQSRRSTSFTSGESNSASSDLQI